jgi:hypothetical protein
MKYVNKNGDKFTQIARRKNKDNSLSLYPISSLAINYTRIQL